MKIELTDEIREELTKNQIARLFTSHVSEHFCKNKTMNQDDFWNYMERANETMKEYMRDNKK